MGVCLCIVCVLLFVCKQFLFFGVTVIMNVFFFLLCVTVAGLQWQGASVGTDPAMGRDLRAEGWGGMRAALANENKFSKSRV